jgi:ribosomal protein S18 acetylase RimI-like enzyme
MTVSVEIISYADEHFDAVNALWREAFPDDAPRNTAKSVIPVKLTVQPDLLLVAMDGKIVVGSILAGFDGFRGWLNRVAVLQSRRRHGIGTRLIAEAERRLKSLGCTKINLQIVGSNYAVAEFYQRLGYAVEDRISMGKRVFSAGPE